MVAYARLKSGEWGLRGKDLIPGEPVSVSKKDGNTATETVGVLLFATQDGTQYATIEKTRRSTRRRNWKPCGYPGCSPGYCDECGGDGFYKGMR